MEYYITFFTDLTNRMWGTGIFRVLFFVGLIIIAALEKKRLRKLRYIGLSIIVLIIIYNPVTLWISEKIFGSAELLSYYCRYFLMLPIVFVIAYAFVLLLQYVKGIKKFLLVICLMLLIIQNGNCVYKEDWYVKAINPHKVSPDALQLSELLGENHEDVKILVPQDLSWYVRQVDAGIYLQYGKNFEGQENIVYQISSEHPDPWYVIEFAKNNGCDYIVCLNNPMNCENFQTVGGEIVGYTNSYVLIKV